MSKLTIYIAVALIGASASSMAIKVTSNNRILPYLGRSLGFPA